MLNRGRIERDGTPKELRASKDELVASFARASYSAVERAGGAG